MKEIIRIHLAQTPFNAELAAKKQLEQYLEAIKRALGAANETMREIEARMVELLAERGITGEKVITEHDIVAIKAQLGEPRDFADEDTVEESRTGKDISRRLLRDTDRGILGGVAAGIASYLRVNPMWVRLLMLLAIVVSFGTAIVVYAVLWLITPAARSAAEKLQMRGEPVTLAALQIEAANEQPAVPERSKPFVIALRMILTVGFLGMGILALVAVGAGIFGVWLPAVDMGQLVNFDQPWLTGTIVVMSLSGLLFVLLMGIAAYSSATWRFSKRLAQAVFGVIAAGVVLFTIGIGTGSVAVRDINRRVDELRTTSQQATPLLKNARSLVVENSAYTIRYVVATGQPRIEMTYLKGQAKPQVELHRDGKKIYLKASQDANRDCGYGDYFCQSLAEKTVTVYGPALETIATKEADVTYKAESQQTLSYTAISGGSSRFELTGRIATFKTALSSGANVNARAASVDRVEAILRTTDGNTLELGNIRSFSASAPRSCGSETRNSIFADSITIMKINGQSIDATKENTNLCLEITDESRMQDDDAL